MTCLKGSFQNPSLSCLLSRSKQFEQGCLPSPFLPTSAIFSPRSTVRSACLNTGFPSYPAATSEHLYTTFPLRGGGKADADLCMIYRIYLYQFHFSSCFIRLCTWLDLVGLYLNRSMNS